MRRRRNILVYVCGLLVYVKWWFLQHSSQWWYRLDGDDGDNGHDGHDDGELSHFHAVVIHCLCQDTDGDDGDGDLGMLVFRYAALRLIQSRRVLANGKVLHKVNLYSDLVGIFTRLCGEYEDVWKNKGSPICITGCQYLILFVCREGDVYKVVD